MLKIFYDGDCGICKKQVGRWIRKPRNQTCEFKPIQEVSREEFRRYVIPFDQRLKKMWAVENERAVGGYKAFIVAEFRGTRMRVLEHVLLFWPIRLAGTLIYLLIASQRKRLGSNSCSLHGYKEL
jgi:predicted DCC family thiol-disulfide oxidoreductase YuxK